MFNAEEMSNDQLTLLPTGSFINVSGANVSQSTIYPNDIFIPLQYIGLKDKKGVEIYDGDIFRLHDNNNGYLEVFWNEDRWSAKHGEDVLKSTFNHLGKIEVIGNIYQNPELLKS